MSNPKDLAMMYGMKRKNKKAKMADGGPVSAKTESRPMPTTEANDKSMVSRNSGDKPANMDSWTSRPDMRSQRGPKTTPIKHPRMVTSDAFSTKLRSDEDHLESTASVNNGPQTEPPKSDDEMSPDRSGPSTPSLKMKRMAEGGMINEEISMHDAEMDEVEHPAGLESDNDSMGDDDAMEDHFADGGMADAVIRRRYADGGQVDIDMNAEEQPNGYYDQNEDAALKENYDSDMDDVSQPTDSNEHGHTLSDEDAHDLVNTIRAKLSKKRINGNK